ncbi:MAG: YqjF family protein [Micromonosporaceae bacterium]
MNAEPVTAVTPRPVRYAVMAQWWREVAFLHWPVDPELATRLMPPRVRPDLHDGVTYVGLVAFRMARTRLLGLPPVPYLGSFPETNVRLYSVDAQGRRGVVFLSMDAARLVPVTAARAVLGLPYRWSTMGVAVDGDTRVYRCRRSGGGHSRLRVRVGERITPSPLELFLTARWGLHHGRRYLANEHPSWPLRRAELVDCDDTLVTAAGLPGIADQPPVSVLYSPVVYARFGPTAG